MNYQYPKFTGDISTLQDDTRRAAVEKLFADADTANNAAYQTALEKHKQIVALAREIYGPGSNQVNYLRKNEPEKPKSNQATFKTLMRRFADWQEEQRHRVKQAEYRQTRRQKIDAVVAQLEQRGFKAGVDFKREDALTFALTVLVEEGEH